MKSLKSIRSWLFIATVALFICGFSFSKEESKGHVFLLPQHLQTGDIILRDSKGMLASFFRNMSKQDKRYSHAGFIVVGTKTWVCHYIDNEKENGKGLMVEELKDFVNDVKCNAFGVYRFELTATERANLVDIIRNDIHHPVFFDSDFNLKTDDYLYCTEWISKSLWKAAQVRIPVTESAGMEYISNADLYINSKCRMVAAVRYSNKNKIDRNSN